MTTTTPTTSPNDDEVAASAIQSCWRAKRKRDIAKEAAQATARALTTKREAGILPKAVTDLIERIGDGSMAASSNITTMLVVRTPVQEYVGYLMEIISIGKYKEAIAESPYDKMFHLSVLLNGRYVLQKNEVIDLSDCGAASITEESETMRVDIPPATSTTTPLTFTTLLDNTKQLMGDVKFTDYCAVTNNCQDFILAVLRGNGLATAELEAFVKQDAEGIFNRLPIHTRPVAKALTDSAAVANKLVEDITTKHKETDYSALLEDHVPPEKLDEANRIMTNLKLTKSEAEDILKRDGRKRDKFSDGLGLLKSKLKGGDKEERKGLGGSFKK